MSRRTLWIIVSLMSIALVGLVGFQLYWINNAINLSSERFEKDVQESLRNVAEKLERNEMLYLVTKNELWENDSLKGASWTASTSDQHNNEKEFITDSLNQMQRFKFKTNQNKIEFIYQSEVKEGKDEQNVSVITKSIWSNISDLDNVERIDPKKLENKTSKIEVVVQEILELESGKKSRFHPKVLDSLLHEEFANKGISTAYEYGVFNKDENNFVIAKANDKELLLNSGLKANLFPNDLLGNVNYLMVNFPKQNSFLLKQISATLATSVVLIGVIIFCFAYAILTILRQKKLSEIKNDFINNMTHEFKTPITTVSLASQALGEEVVINDRKTYERYLKVISDETDKLGSQVEKVLQAASFDKRDFKINRKTVDIVAPLHQLIDSFRVQVESRSGKIETSFSQKSLHAHIDLPHFINAVQNLLDNALKYSDTPPRIEIGLRSDKSGFTLIVTDNGIGIRKEQLGKIFDKFYRVPKGNVHDVKGFGLGLSYVKSIVDAHKGTMTVESQPGKGSAFTIKIPLDD